MEAIQGVLTEVLMRITLALIALIAAFVLSYIKKASDKLKVEIEVLENEDLEKLISRAFDRLAEVTKLTVNKIEQQSARTIREAVNEGKLSKDELEKLSKEAYEEILRVLEPEYKEFLQDMLGDIETYILNLIEEKLVSIKERDQVFEIQRFS
ncbi:hypothetical protein KQI38_09365 [Tissierella carlieri]|uniref:hypothetical protein n=1 Tax=Tissierella carlieri TaxID=689904 RepID=UPI001C114798|nr:hypothetical protein [Tissierella carlieri]MBU5312235.1 hypothetical protein [Tissierella carlieri]